jgi:NAD(P)-dependent dehydrogenase (short-subunit alcohol dehydrogenase family)
VSSHSKVALVTGAGSGIGRAVAVALLREGYRVVLTGRRANMLGESIGMAGEAGENASAIPADVSDDESVAQLFGKIEELHGRLDVLFNNAGIGAPAVEIDELTVEQWKRVVDVNLTGVFLCSQAAFGLMKRQTPMGGRIINNGSISATTPRPLSAPYTSTKHAVTGLTKSLALDGRRYNIACGQIDIGNADTEMASKMKRGILQPSGAVEVEPTMDLEHVAESVLLMARMPLDTNILSMTVMATKMPFVGRG